MRKSDAGRYSAVNGYERHVGQVLDRRAHRACRCKPADGALDAECPAARRGGLGESWLRGQDLNLRPSGYEPDELPGCSTPRHRPGALGPLGRQCRSRGYRRDRKRVGRAFWCRSEPHVRGFWRRETVVKRLFGWSARGVARCGDRLGWPGNRLLSQALRHSTIGAEVFDGRVRDGIGSGHLAKVTRPAKPIMRNNVKQAGGPSTRLLAQPAQDDDLRIAPRTCVIDRVSDP